MHNIDGQRCIRLTWRQVVVVPDVEPVAEESFVQEDVGEAKDGQHDDEVQELAEDKAPEVDAKAALDAFGEVLKKFTGLRFSVTRNFFSKCL